MKRTAKTGFWIIFCAFALAALHAAPALAQMVGIARDGQMGFQPAATPMKAQMEHFHDSILLPIITVITLFVMALLLYVMVRFNARANPTPSKTTHNVTLEVVWTLVPVLILLFIVIPSMKMLYYVDKTQDAEMTLKAIGNQWYWSYEYPDHGNFSFISNIVKDENLKEGQPRLLATDNPVVLPVDTNIRLLTTASDVLHAWAIPAFGVKIDANPGQLNETWMRIEKEGVFYGQCSELCGSGHGFMPIEVHAVSKEKFAEWVQAQGGTMPPPPGSAVAAPPAQGIGAGDKGTVNEQGQPVEGAEGVNQSVPPTGNPPADEKPAQQ